MQAVRIVYYQILMNNKSLMIRNKTVKEILMNNKSRKNKIKMIK